MDTLALIVRWIQAESVKRCNHFKPSLGQQIHDLRPRPGALTVYFPKYSFRPSDLKFRGVDTHFHVKMAFSVVLECPFLSRIFKEHCVVDGIMRRALIENEKSARPSFRGRLPSPELT